jgi:hypothetical protein
MWMQLLSFPCAQGAHRRVIDRSKQQQRLDLRQLYKCCLALDFGIEVDNSKNHIETLLIQSRKSCTYHIVIHNYPSTCNDATSTLFGLPVNPTLDMGRTVRPNGNVPRDICRTADTRRHERSKHERLPALHNLNSLSHKSSDPRCDSPRKEGNVLPSQINRLS